MRSTLTPLLLPQTLPSPDNQSSTQQHLEGVDVVCAKDAQSETRQCIRGMRQWGLLQQQALGMDFMPGHAYLRVMSRLECDLLIG